MYMISKQSVRECVLPERNTSLPFVPMTRNLLITSLLCFATLSSAQKIPNGSFEEWVIQGNDTLPKGWTVSSFGAGRSADASHGESALNIWNWYCYAKGTATISTSFPYGPGVFHVNGSYKYILGQNGGSGQGADDSAVAIVVFRKYNQSTKTSDTLGFALAKLGPSHEYRSFDIGVLIPSEADTLELSFSSSEKGFCSSEDCLCCYFTFDNLSWTALIGSTDDVFQRVEDHPATPNPFATETLLGIAPEGGCRLVASNLKGTDVYEQEFREGERVVLPAENLPSGTYLYRIISKIDIRSGKVIKQ